MWNMIARVTPVILGAPGTVSKYLSQYLSNISGKREIKDLKKGLIGHCKHTTGSTNVKVQNISRAK